MRIAYAGTPAFAVPALAALLDAGHEIVGVWTQPDRPAGRGLKYTPSPVKQLALEHALPVHQPVSLRDEEAIAALRACAADVMVVAAYGLLLPPAVLQLFPYGAINIHASLLPRWRGAAPIHRALLAGDEETGISIMQMDAGLDTGPVLWREAIPILPTDTTGSLHDRLATLGAQTLLQALEGVAAGTLEAIPQPSEGVTYAAKIDKAEAQVDWRLPAAQIDRQIRAFNPFPGAATHLNGQPLKLWQAMLTVGQGEPGTVLAIDAHSITVACGEAALALQTVQRAGGRRVSAGDYARGHDLSPGDRFGELSSAS